MTYTPLKHIIFVPGPPWGHLRPGLKTAVRMVEKFQNAFISLFVYHTEVSRAMKYLSTQSSDSRRIKIVTATSNGEVPISLSSGSEVEVLISFEKAFKLWITNELHHPSTIQFDGRPVEEPSLIIEDIFGGGVAVACKGVHKLPIVGWWLIPAASLIIQTKEGRSATGNSDKTYQCDTRGKKMLTNGDEIHPKEPIAAAAFSKIFNVTTFFVGPAVDVTPPNQPDPESAVTQFLDRAYAEKGAHSVIYVAFGTVFFPPESSMNLLMAALDEIPKSGFKFVFALSSGRARLDESWMDAHVQAGNAVFPEWANQTAVLEHPAIHYFLSHGGWNSSTEAIVRGVPMIFWPIAGDQPLNAIQIASVHDCGFELLQVRTGPAKSTAYRNGTDVKIVGTDDAVREEMRGILDLSKGSRGDHQRANVGLLGKIVAGSLAPGGSGDMGMEKCGKALGLL